MMFDFRRCSLFLVRPSSLMNSLALISTATTAPPVNLSPSSAPVLRGEVIYVKLLPRFSIEGYTAQASDTSHWADESLGARVGN